MKINFNYNHEKDVWCILNKGKSSNNSQSPTKVYEQLTATYGNNLTNETVSDFIKKYISENNINLQEYIASYQVDWNSVEEEYNKRAEAIFQTKLPENITVYLTINNRCPYNIEENYFFVSVPASSVRKTIMHELFHFYTWYAFGEKLMSQGVSKEKYNDIKESLTVILNTDFSDLLDGAIDNGYPQHQEMRSEVIKLWAEYKSMDKVIETLVNMSTTQDKLKLQIQKLLGKEIDQLILKGKGDCNYAYYIETKDGGKYIVKQERGRKETENQNDLVTEGNLLQKLFATNLSIPIPKVIFVSENPKLYGYEYIEGELMRRVWNSLSEDERIHICRSLGRFHAEIGKIFTKEMCEASGIDINDSIEPHPQVSKEYEMLTADPNVPTEFNDLVREAKKIFDGTADKVVFQFLHNDGHHENVIIKSNEISGVIDFGNSEYGETAKEFSRYIRDYPDYFPYIVSSYEEISGNKLSYARLVSNALISGFIDIVQDYWKGGEDKVNAEKAMAKYATLINKITIEAILEKIIDREFKSKILSIKDLTLGWSGAGVYAVETTDSKLIVKLRNHEKEPAFKEEPVDNRVYGSRFSNLMPAYNLLKEKGILVPKLFAVGKQDNYIYAIMEKLKGDTKIPQEMVGEELGKIHNITREYYGWIDATLKTDWKDDFFTAIDIQLKKAADANSTMRERIKEIESFIVDKKSNWVNPKEFVLSHTDGFQAMAKEQNGEYILTGVIDLEDYAFTDQRFVLSGLDLLSDWWINKKLSDQFWDNYRKHKKVDPTYTTFKSLFQLFYILSWLPGYYTNSKSDEIKKQATIKEAERRLFNLLK